MRWLCWLAFLFTLCCTGSSAAMHSDRYDASFARWGRLYLPWQDWRYLKAQGVAESALNPAAVSDAGALGLMQFLPATARELGVNPLDPESAIQGAALYNRMLQDQWRAAATSADRRDLALASYNAGPLNIARAVKLAGAASWRAVAQVLRQVTGRHAGETTAYVARIEALVIGGAL